MDQVFLKYYHKHKKILLSFDSNVTSAKKLLSKFLLKKKVIAFCLIGNKRKFKVGVDFTTLQKRPGVGKIEKQRSRRQLYYAHWDETFSEGKGNCLDFQGNTCKFHKKPVLINITGNPYFNKIIKNALKKCS